MVPETTTLRGSSKQIFNNLLFCTVGIETLNLHSRAYISVSRTKNKEALTGNRIKFIALKWYVSLLLLMLLLLLPLQLLFEIRIGVEYTKKENEDFFAIVRLWQQLPLRNRKRETLEAVDGVKFCPLGHIIVSDEAIQNIGLFFCIL